MNCGCITTIKEGLHHCIDVSAEGLREVSYLAKELATGNGLKTTANTIKSICVTATYIFENYYRHMENPFALLDKHFSPMKKFANSLSLFFLIPEWLTDPLKGGLWLTAARTFNTVAAVADGYQLLTYLELAASHTATVKLFDLAFTVSAETIKSTSIVLGSLCGLIDASISIAQLIHLCTRKEGKPQWTEFIKPLLSIGFSTGKIFVIIFAGPEVFFAFVCISIGTSAFSLLKLVWKQYQDRRVQKVESQLRLVEKKILKKIQAEANTNMPISISPRTPSDPKKIIDIKTASTEELIAHHQQLKKKINELNIWAGKFPHPSKAPA